MKGEIDKVNCAVWTAVIVGSLGFWLAVGIAIWRWTRG